MRVFREGLTTFAHWFGWTISVVASIFFLYFLIGEGIPDLLKGKNIEEMKYFLPFLLLAIIGCFLSFFKIKSGGLMMLTGGIGMVVYFYIKSGLSDFSMMVVYGIPYILAGFLFLVVKD
jgi:hypothetical protein